MSKPKRPIAIWIAIVLLALAGTTFLLPFLYGMLISFISAIPGLGSSIMTRSSVLLPPALGCWLSILLIVRRRNWGRWLAMVSLAIFGIEFWMFEVFVSSQWKTVNTLTEAIGYAFAMAIPTAPVLVVGALLTVGKRTSSYFAASPAGSELKMDPPPPPAF